MIKPTVGRIIWYWPKPDKGDIAAKREGQPLSATVAAVNDDDTVNLAVLDANGRWHAQESVVLFQGEEGAEAPEHSHATWMPYQIGQAKVAAGPAGELSGLAATLGQGDPAAPTQTKDDEAAAPTETKPAAASKKK